MDSEIKKLFFAFEIMAPWPTEYPKGRLLAAESRHLTLAFLGNVNYFELKMILPEFPPLPFQVGPVGVFNKVLFLPPRRPHVVAWHSELDAAQPLNEYYHQLIHWLTDHHYRVDERDFLPHVTIARSPFVINEWRKSFFPIPMAITGLHLYESVGNLIYTPIWTYPLLSPFQELDHTADIAFLIRGETIEKLHFNAQIALAFKHSPMLPFIHVDHLESNLDDLIISLNALISRVDCEIGSPFKAVSFHGDLQEENHILKWEMIVDV